MELTWLMKLRIAAAAAVGVALIGIVSWPTQTTLDPFGTLLLKDIGTNGAVTLLVMAFLAGLISYFITWPYGREIGILAVPAGLCIWSVRAGSIGALIQLNPTEDGRQAVLETLRWEPAFWLLVIGCGFAGVSLAQRIAAKLRKQQNPEKINYTPTKFVYMIISLLLSVVIAVFCIRLFARDVGVLDGRLTSIAAQPALGQIIFAVLMAFGIAAFVSKVFFDVGYFWPMISCVVVSIYAISSYMRQDVIEYFMQHWPAVFFPNAVVSILPIQIVTFGAIGSVAGYWMAVRYIYWRKHEM
jgi:hypothetical protein